MTVMGSVAEVVADINRGAENTCPRDVIYQIRMQIRDYREEYFSRRLCRICLQRTKGSACHKPRLN